MLLTLEIIRLIDITKNRMYKYLLQKKGTFKKKSKIWKKKIVKSIN